MLLLLIIIRYVVVVDYNVLCHCQSGCLITSKDSLIIAPFSLSSAIVPIGGGNDKCHGI